MKFTCDSNELIRILGTVTKALPSKTTNPVLDGIKIVADENSVTMTCTDEKITIVSNTNAVIKESGSGIIPGKLFAEVVRKLNDGDISVAMNERNMFAIRGSNSRTNIAGQSADLFPELPTINEQHSISISQAALKDMIEKTAFAIAVEDMREVLTGALLEINQGEINMVGLDGYRMAVRRIQCATSIDNCSAIIPGNTLRSIAKLLSDNEEDHVYITLGGNKLHIKFDNTDVYSVLIEGDYIDYKKIIPQTFSTQLEIDTDQFAKAIDRASLIARDGNNNLLIFRIMNGEMSIESKSQIGDTLEKIEVVQVGNDLNVAFNVKYLLDVIKNISTDVINVNLNGSTTPSIITPAGDGNYIHLVLPVRTSSV